MKMTNWHVSKEIQVRGLINRIELATCVHYVDINNSMLCMRGHIFAGFFHCDVLFLQGKHNGLSHIVANA